MNVLKKLFGGGGAATAGDANAILYYVRGFKCRAVSRVRINKSNDLSRNDDDTGYFVRKVIVDDTCYGQVEVELSFDLNYKETSRSIHGGEFIDAATYAAATQSTTQVKAA